jgi:transcription-repair coupling factor (superfamily II helicase)
MAHKVFVEELSAKKMTIKFSIYEKASINPMSIQDVLMVHGGFLSFKAVGKPYFLYQKEKSDERSLLEISRAVLSSMCILVE